MLGFSAPTGIIMNEHGMEKQGPVIDRFRDFLKRICASKDETSRFARYFPYTVKNAGAAL